MANSFSIVHQNIQSINAKFSTLLANLNAFSELPDLLFLSEIWAEDEIIEDFTISHYSMASTCNSNYRAGGVAVYFRNTLPCSSMSLNLTTCDVIKSSVTINNIDITFICFYRFHFHSVDDFLVEISNILANEKSKNIVLLGDFNIDFLSPCRHTNEYNILLSSYGFVQLIHEPTRPISGTCLDHIWIKILHNGLSNYSSSVLNLKISDHCWTSLDFSMSNSHKIINNFTFKPSLKLDKNKLFDFLSNESWLECYALSNPSLSFDKFQSILETHVSNSTISKVIKKPNVKLKPWISNKLTKLIDKRNKLAKKVRKHPYQTRLFSHYNIICESVKDEIKKCRDTFYHTKLDEHSGNSKFEWKMVNSILNKDVTSNVSSILVDNIPVSDTLTISNHFNSFFTNISDKVPISSPSSNVLSASSLDLVPDSVQSNSFFFTPFTSLEIINIINSLKNSCSTNHFFISNKTLKEISFLIADVVCFIFNNSVTHGLFPASLKNSIVIPLHKKGSKLDANNYRPISLLSPFSKVFEKGIKSRVVSFLDHTNFFSSAQFGFRKNLSTEQALEKFSSEILNGLISSKMCAGLFIDITKAFDMVDHSLLLQKLENAGFRYSSLV